MFNGQDWLKRCSLGHDNNLVEWLRNLFKWVRHVIVIFRLTALPMYYATDLKYEQQSFLTGTCFCRIISCSFIQAHLVTGVIESFERICVVRTFSDSQRKSYIPDIRIQFFRTRSKRVVFENSCDRAPR